MSITKSSRPNTTHCASPHLGGATTTRIRWWLSSTSINGLPVHANHELLTVWLKEQTGWDGVLITDWADVNNLYTREMIARDKKDALRPYQLLSGETYSDFAGRTIKLHLGCQDSALYAFDHQGRIFAYDEVLDSFRLRADVGEMLETAVVLNDICVSAHGIWLAMREGVYFLHDKVLTPVVRGGNTIFKHKNTNPNYITPLYWLRERRWWSAGPSES